ncbi:MAG: translocation/assembly module TamB domain-containing protein, partial [Bacteroidales bacterium]|nr:translocation/assembly module TamB domain-containing protein [Bacteroidales bacterium]
GTNNLNLGKILSNSKFGKVSLSADASGSINDISIYDLSVDRFDFNNYSYTGVRAMGHLEDKTVFAGSVYIDDPSVKFGFDGIAGLVPKRTSKKEKYKFTLRDLVFDFNASAHLVDIQALNFKMPESLVAFSLPSVSASRDSNSNGYSEEINLNGISITDNVATYDYGNLNYTADKVGTAYTATIASSIIDGVFHGNLENAIADFKNALINRNFPSSLAKAEYRERLDYEYSFSAVLKNISSVLGYFVNGIYIEKGTSLDATLSKDNVLDVRLKSKRLALKTNYLKSMGLMVHSDDEGLHANLSGDRLSVLGHSFMENYLDVYAKNDSVKFTTGYHNDNSSSGFFCLNGLLGKDENDRLAADIVIGDSYIQGMRDYWKSNNAPVSFGGDDFNVGGLSITSKLGDDIFLNGGKTAGLDLNINSFNIAALSALLNTDFGGNLSGNVNLKLLENNENFLNTELNIRNAVIESINAGDINLSGNFNKGDGVISALLKNTKDSIRPLWADVSYEIPNRALEGEVFLDSFNLGELAPFLSKVVTDLEGTADGHVMLRKPQAKKFYIASDSRLSLRDVKMKVVPTGVNYSVNGSIYGTNNNIFSFRDFVIRDTKEGTAELTGGVDMTNPSGVKLDAKAKIRNIECINLPKGSAVSGNVYADCDAHFHGPISALVLDAKAEISDPSKLELDLWGNPTQSSKKSMLTFTKAEVVEEEDAYEVMLERLKTVKEESRGGGFKANLILKVNDDLAAKVSFLEGGASNINIKGNGDIGLTLDSSKGSFETHGDYTISEGKCHLDLAVVREFTISDGSAIHINSPISESSLDIKAIYKTKANLATLIADTTAVSQRKVVNCNINITDRISDPKIAFSIDIPELDSTVKSQVESALNTDDKVQRQFVALLVSNSFLPSEESGIVNNSTLVFSNASQILANQFNKMLGKFNIPIDLGLNYQPSAAGGRDIFDVAISTQLFNNRVEIGGQISNGNNINSSGNNSIAGDLDVEVKVDKKGALRVKGFSHSADKYTSYLDNSQRNGVGISYQKEFNTFKELWNDIFHKKKKKKEEQK